MEKNFDLVRFISNLTRATNKAALIKEKNKNYRFRIETNVNNEKVKLFIIQGKYITQIISYDPDGSEKIQNKMKER